MPAASLIGMVVVVTWRGLPTGFRQTSGFVGLILTLIAVTWLSVQLELVRACWMTVTVVIRLGLAACWVGVFCGIVAVPLWLRRRIPSTPAPAWVKMWFAATLCAVSAEAGARVLSRDSHTVLTLPDHWNSQERSEDEFCIAAIGGSTMRGYPYEPKIDIPIVCSAHLRSRYPEQSFIVKNLAVTGISFRGAIQQLETLDVRPDMIIVYTGHNEEFFDVDNDVVQSESVVPLVDVCFEWSAAYRAVSAAVQRMYFADRDHAYFGRKLFDSPQYSGRVSQERLARFRRTLVEFTRSCRQQEISLIWFVPAAGEGTFEPNRSYSQRHISTERREEIRGMLAAARQLEQSGRWNDAEDIYRELLAEHPDFAEFHFRLAETLVEQEAIAEAKSSFQAAIDRDGHPCQAPSSYRQCIVEVARQEETPLIDAAEVLSAITEIGLLDRTVIHDHVHPTLTAYVALGRAAAELAIEESLIAESTDEPSIELDPLDLSELVSNVEFDAHDLAIAYDRIAFALEHFAIRRYDGGRRSAEAAQYRLWAEGLRSGEIQPGEGGTESLSQLHPAGVRFPPAE